MTKTRRVAIMIDLQWPPQLQPAPINVGDSGIDALVIGLLQSESCREPLLVRQKLRFLGDEIGIMSQTVGDVIASAAHR